MGERDTNEEGMAGIMVNYFTTLFTSAEGDARPALECLDRRISDVQNAELTRAISAEEVRATIFAMHPDKSPGPDGLSPSFFRPTSTFWAMR